jgi:hypothetical protein
MKKENVFLNYDAPIVEIIEVMVELGFNLSGNDGENYDVTNGSWNN